MKVLGFVGLVWSLAVIVHFLWEAWIIARSDCQEIPVCLAWWCPDGWRNRFLRWKAEKR